VSGHCYVGRSDFYRRQGKLKYYCAEKVCSCASPKVNPHPSEFCITLNCPSLRVDYRKNPVGKPNWRC
jgi:hypothetical protein